MSFLIESTTHREEGEETSPTSCSPRWLHLRSKMCLVFGVSVCCVCDVCFVLMETPRRLLFGSFVVHLMACFRFGVFGIPRFFLSLSLLPSLFWWDFVWLRLWSHLSSGRSDTQIFGRTKDAHGFCGHQTCTIIFITIFTYRLRRQQAEHNYNFGVYRHIRRVEADREREKSLWLPRCAWVSRVCLPKIPKIITYASNI